MYPVLLPSFFPPPTGPVQLVNVTLESCFSLFLFRSKGFLRKLTYIFCCLDCCHFGGGTYLLGALY